MPYVRIRIPEGKICRKCPFKLPGTVICVLFDRILAETGRIDETNKCTECASLKEEDIVWQR